MIFVTGADGLIGGALLGALRARGLACEGSALSPGVRALRQLDLRSPGEAELPEGITTAVLCAWNGGVAECASDPAAMGAVNVDGNLALIERLQRAGAKVIFLSTSLVFAGRDTGPQSPVDPCCEYARQKAAVEVAADTVVRVTKVGETLLPRLRGWAGQLRSGTPVRAADWLRLAPVLLGEVVPGLASLAATFQGGIFQMSGTQDHTYFDMASTLAARLGAPAGLVEKDSVVSPFFQMVPACGALQVAPPEGCADWPQGGDVMQILVEQAIS